MKVNDKRRAILIQGAAAMVGLPLAARVLAAGSEAGGYPEKPMKIVVPFAPGGPTDLMARAISRPMSESLGQTIVVINKPGGTGVIALSEVRNAPADGYTLAFPSIQAVTAPALRSDFPFDMDADFTGVSVVGYISHLLVVNVKTPVNTLSEFIDMVKAKPSAYFYGSFGNGSSGHLAMEMFKDRAGIALEHTPYKGAAPAIQDLLSGRIHAIFLDTTVALPLLKDNKIKALAVPTAKRSPLAPDVPTIAEQGFPGFEIHPWYGLLARAGTDPAIISKLNEHVKKALADTRVAETFKSMGIEPGGNSAEAFNQVIREDLKTWDGIAKKLNLKIQ